MALEVALIGLPTFAAKLTAVFSFLPEIGLTMTAKTKLVKKLSNTWSRSVPENKNYMKILSLKSAGF